MGLVIPSPDRRRAGVPEPVQFQNDYGVKYLTHGCRTLMTDECVLIILHPILDMDIKTTFLNGVIDEDFYVWNNIRNI